MQQGRELLREWFNGLDAALAANAARASTSDHPTMIGNEREKVFRDSLREFLPPAIHVGSGKIISTEGKLSRQIDVVLCDARFPVFKQGDSAMFPVEGVFATIEVKSSLDRDELLKAWRNCLSVMMLNPSIVQEDLVELMETYQGLGRTEVQAAFEVDRRVRPRTYIFAYAGLSKLESFADALDSVLKEVGVDYFGEEAPIVPSLIASGGVLGLAWNDPFRILPQGENPIPPGGHVVLQSFECQHRFGVLASHILWHIERRTTLMEKTFGIRRSIADYLPIEEYVRPATYGKRINLTLTHRPEI